MQRIWRNLHRWLLCCLLCCLSLGTATPPAPVMYWEGAGDTPPMEAYANEGRYPRFDEVPIAVFLDAQAAAEWQQALDHSLAELQGVVPLRRGERAAPLQIRVLSPLQFWLLSPCEWQTDGCGVLNIGPNGPEGWVWVRENPSLPLEHLLLHEIIHALGLRVHSPHPGDVMYNGQDAAPTRLSPRDVATLRYLYQQPAWENSP